MRSLGLLSAAFLLTTPLPAQQVIRWASLQGNREAHVESVDQSGTLVVRLGNSGDFATINPDTIPNLTYRTGGATRGTNGLIGMTVGAILGGVIGFAGGDDKCGEGFLGCFMVLTAETKAGLGAVGGALVGALVGAIALPAAHWVPWEKGATAGRIRPTAGVTSAGAPKLGMRISF